MFNKKGSSGDPFLLNGAGCVDELTEFDKIAGSDFGRAQRARRARARMARVDPTLFVSRSISSARHR
jgi:hypothetical protein